MNMHPREDELQDLVSGDLMEDRAAVIRRHVDDCAACRAELEVLASLVASLGELPPEIRPAHDLRAGIWQRIDAEDGTQATRRSADRAASGPASPFRLSLAAAAVVLVAVAAVLSFVIGGGDGGEPVAVGAMPELRVAEQRYEDASRELQALLDEQRDLLAPDTREVLERSLATIDAAVAEARAALSDDPGNAMLARMLMAVYDRKLDILRAAAEAPVGI